MRNLLLLLAAALLALAGPPARRAPALAAAPANLLPNGSFEAGLLAPGGAPDGWARELFDGSAELAWREDVALVGRRSAGIRAPSPNDASWVATVPVRPHTLYALSGWIKTERVAHSGQPVDAGANLSVVGTWTRTPGVFGTSDWTYVSVVLNSGDQSELRVGARLGYWASTTTGAAWFDGLRLAPIEPGAEAPPWRILVLIYGATDFTYVDAGGVERHVVARMSPEERDRAAREAAAFVTQDIPALTSGLMLPRLTIRYPEAPLSRLSPQGGGWWPAPEDTAAERDPSFDSVIVIWDPRAVDQRTGEAVWIGSAAGLTPPMGTGQTYATQIVESTGYGHRNVFKHEWGHSILFYFEAAGTAPRPTVDNHASPGQYVHCPTGEPYVWADETDANPIPNSIYHNSSGFTHDYYSGTVATPDQPTRCLGITPAAWAAGGPVSHPGYYPYYHQLELSPASSEQTAGPGEAVRHHMALLNTGNTTDTFRLEVDGAAWEVEAPAEVGPVGAGQSVQVELAVRVPQGAMGDARDEAMLVAVSVADPSQAARATITSVAARRYGLGLGPAASEQVGGPGSAVRHTLELANTGNVTDSVALTLGGHRWPAQVQAVLRELAPGARTRVTVTVTIPPGAAPGASDSVTVRASSGGGAAIATATLVTRALPPSARYEVMIPLLRR